MKLLHKLRRFFLRHRWLLDYEASLNRRADVEQELLEISSGKKPIQDRARFRKLALKLGVPDAWRDDSERRALRELVSAAQKICDAGGLIAHASGCGDLRKAMAVYLRESS